MELDQNMTNLICDLERAIGKECYNPNSYDGWTCEWGRSFRYPVHFLRNADDEDTTSTKLNVKHFGIGPDQIKTMKYKFGSNHLFIGEGILNVLETLEQRYGLDFNKLEEEYREKEKENSHE